MIVVGLGNPGVRYKNNRHNVGFMVTEKLKTKKEKVKTIQPDSYMNRSGEAVKQYKAEDLIVIHDDVDLPLGTLRIRKGGSSAGHKGVQSIIDAVGEDFWRVRVGVSRPPKSVATEDYILTNFSENEKDLLTKIITKTADLILQAVKKGEIIAQTITVG